MSTKPKNQRTFIAVTLLTVMAITAVFVVYAAILATYTGTTVQVSEGSGSIQYSLDQSNWLSSLPGINNGTAWYARISMTGAAAQAVTIPWTLQKNVAGTWTDQTTPVTTSMTLAAGANLVYATIDGTATGNTNWGALTIIGGDYRIRTVVSG